MAAKKRPRTIALTLDLQWPYKRHAEVYAGALKYAAEQEWRGLIDEFSSDTLARQDANSVAYDGIIARANRSLLRQAKRLGVPVVNVWASSPVRDELPGVFPDATSLGKQCAEHLLSRGFRNFATLTPPSHAFATEIAREIARVVGEAGFPCAREKFPHNPWRDVSSWRSAEKMLRRCFDGWRTPIGIYLADEGDGRFAVQECERRGWRVPDDVAIIAGQNEETLCEQPRPTLTSMETGYKRIGYEAARLLHDLMDGKTPPSTSIRLAPTGLVIRESTDFFSVNDDIVAAALQFIAANSHRAIGQDDVSKAVFAETRTLQNRFNKCLGRPIVAEIRRVRIERAKRELVQSDRRLSDIARGVGFGDAMRMYEVFRRELGVTPSDYREQRKIKSGD